MKFTLIPLFFISSASGASLLTLSNPVADNAIVTSAGNNDRSDWGPTIAFTTDADESHGTDFQSITVAHDSNYFYIREQMYRTENFGFLASNQVILFDTDQNRSIGYTGPDGAYSIGADYLLEGTSLYAFNGNSQSDFAWIWLATVSFDDFPYNDHELSFSRSLIGSPESFDFIAVSSYYGSGDNYPDSAISETGGYFTYTTVPEPTATVLGGLATLVLLGRRSKSRSHP